MNGLQAAIKIQKKLASQVIAKNPPQIKFQFICGVDVAYYNKEAFCCAIVYDNENKKILETVSVTLESKENYVPGFFMLKEANPILKTLHGLKSNFDVLMVDGNGQIHPRFCGLACYIGIKLDKPTIGIAKNLLCGKILPNLNIELKNKIVGVQIKKIKPIYVSVGNKINLETAAKLVKETTTENQWYPEPLRLADYYSKKLKSRLLKK